MDYLWILREVRIGVSTVFSPTSPNRDLPEDQNYKGAVQKTFVRVVPRAQKTNKETMIERGNPLCSDDPEIPESLQEFRENLVDDGIPLQGGSHASSSQEAS